MREGRKHFKYILVLLLIILTGCTQQITQDKSPDVYKGTLDLSSFDFEDSGIVNLDGSWEFYWKELISPDDFSDKIIRNPEFIEVPTTWNKHTIDYDELIGDGYATYRLLITTNNSNESLGLEIPSIKTAYRLWVNDSLVTNGKVGTTVVDSSPQLQPRTVFFNSNQGNIELVIQISNFHHQYGGILGSLRLGTEDQIKLNDNWLLAFDLFLFGSLFVVGIYHIIFFFYRRKEKSNLYFGSFCVMIGVRSLFVGKMFIYQLFPDFNWELALKIEYLTFYLGTPLFILYLKTILSQEISNRVIKLSLVFTFIFSSLVLFNTVKVYGPYNIFYQIYVIIMIIYLLYALIVACFRKRDGALAISLAVVFFVMTIINDILYESSLVYLSKSIVSSNLSSWGFLVFVFSQSTILSRKFTHAFSKIEEMTVDLQQLNESLEVKVKERTIALEGSNEKLQKAYQELSNMEESRIDLLTNISHDLRSPMASVLGYINAINDGIVEDPEQINKYLNRIRERLNGLNYLTEELFDLTQLETRNLKLETQIVSVELMLRKIYEKYLLDVQRAEIGFRFIHSFSDPIYVEIDIARIDRAFANVIYNAIKHTPKNGLITLDYTLSSLDNPSKIIMRVTDTGSGITKEDLPHVFDRFFTGSKSRPSGVGSGLGLSITKEIIEYHNGGVWVESKPGDGTIFYLSLPLA